MSIIANIDEYLKVLKGIVNDQAQLLSLVMF